jgi:hypothetical protein
LLKSFISVFCNWGKREYAENLNQHMADVWESIRKWTEETLTWVLKLDSNRYQLIDHSIYESL